LDVGVTDVPQVPGNVRRGADADEERLRAGALPADPDPFAPAFDHAPRGSVGIGLQPRARQCIGRRRETLGRRRQVAVLALRTVGPEQEASTCKQSKPDQDSDASEDYEDDATGAHW